MTATAAGGAGGMESINRSLPNCGHSKIHADREITGYKEDNDFYHFVYWNVVYTCETCGATSKDTDTTYEAHNYVQDSPEEMWHCHECDKYMNF